MKILCLLGRHKYDVITEKKLEDVYDCDNCFAAKKNACRH